MMPPWLSRVLVALLPPPIPFQTTFPPRGLHSRLGVWGRTYAGAPTESSGTVLWGDSSLVPVYSFSHLHRSVGNRRYLFSISVGIQF